MQGRVLAMPDGDVPGAISGGDGQRYRFAATAIGGAVMRVGDFVDFVVADGEAREIYRAPGSGPALTPALNDVLRQRDWFAFYFSPQGRVGRRDYWLFGFLALLLVNVILGLIPGINVLAFLVTAWCGLALGIKRCHDVNRSGWWNVIPYVLTPLPILGTAVSLVGTYSSRAGEIWLLYGVFTFLSAAAAFGFCVWFIALVLAKPGDPGPNRFGAPPVADNA